MNVCVVYSFSHPQLISGLINDHSVFSRSVLRMLVERSIAVNNTVSKSDDRFQFHERRERGGTIVGKGHSRDPSAHVDSDTCPMIMPRICDRVVDDSTQIAISSL